MATTTDSSGNAVVDGYSTNLPTGSPQLTQATQNIPVGMTSPTNPIPISTPQDTTGNHLSTISSVQSDIAGGLASAQSQLDQANTAVEQANNQGSALSNLLAGTEQGAVKDVAGTYNQQGVTSLYNQLQDLNAQATGLKNEASAIPIQNGLNYQGSAGTQGEVTSVNRDQLSQNALKALSLGQQYAIASGNYNKAKDYADQLIDTKFAQDTAKIQAIKDQQEGLDKYTLTPVETKRLEAQKKVTSLQEQSLTTKIQQSKDALGAVQDAISKGIISSQDGFKTIADIVSGKTDPSTALYGLGISSNSPSKLPADQQSALQANGFTTKYNAQTQDLASQLVNGNFAPSEASKRATGAVSYNNLLDAADKYSMATTGKHYDIAKADRDYKFANNPQTQNTLNYLGSLVGSADGSTTGNLNELINLSNARVTPTHLVTSGVEIKGSASFPPLNDAKQWAKITSGDPQTAQYYSTLLEVSDQIAKVLQGGGNGGTSDAKLAQAQSIFQKGFTPEQVKAVSESLKGLLANRASSMIKDNPYLKDYATQFGVNQSPQPKAPTNTSAPANTVPMTGPDGVQYYVPNDRVQDFLKAGGKQSFNSVGGDTNQASIPTGTLASANNNPGNLRFAGQEGAVQGKGGFAKFSSVVSGVKALKNQISLDAKRGATLASFISKYAPPTENNTQQYIAQIKQAVGADENTPLASIDLNKLASAIAKKESGTTL